MNSELILAGDVGGTKVQLALYAAAEGMGGEPLRQQIYPTAQFESFAALLDDFMGDHAPRLKAACFGVAGPVSDGRAEMTNVHWRVIDERDIRRQFGIERVELINDMIAMGYGALALPPESFAVLNAGEPKVRGNAALIAAGTGLGEAMLFWDGRRWIPSPSEGGHADFAPNSELEIELYKHLHALYGHVSIERILSGPGFFNIYKFLRETGRGEEPAWLAERLANEDSSAVVAELAMKGELPICIQTMDLFVHIYGAEAGNMALKVLASGGVFIGGGIAPKILPQLRRPEFMEGFASKGRLREMMEKIPVKVMLDPRAPLIGAASRAAMIYRGE